MTGINPVDDLLYFNGIDATTGNYLLSPTNPAILSRAIEGVELDAREIEEFKNWIFHKTHPTHGLKEGDPKDLAQAGWGIIFPSNTNPAVRQALSELIEWRHEQATRLHTNYFHEFSGANGYLPGETKLSWLARQGIGPGPVEPDKVPYYLLIAGDPQSIPYRFQTQLDVQYATGRIFFDTPEEYAIYAHSVVETEKRSLSRPRTITFFGVSNADDPATYLSANELVKPLAEDTARDHTDWMVRSLPPDQATKSRLTGLLGGPETPALLFAACHGLAFPSGHPLQRSTQGALLTQDWPGPKQFQQPLPRDYYFSADDLSQDARLLGLLAFLFACYGAGTPQFDEFAQSTLKTSQVQLAPQAFVSALPRRMLAHPHGSALAVIGHVDRTWGYSFFWSSAKRQLAVFESTLSLLFKGFPVGAALDPFNLRYAELSSDLNLLLEDIQFGKKYDPRELAGMWTANNDARNYAILGDPAVRLMAASLESVVSASSQAGAFELDLPSGTTPASGAPRPGALEDDTNITMAMSGQEAVPAYQILGRLFSVALDDSYILPNSSEIILGRRDAASQNYPDIDLGNQGQASASVSRRHARITIQDKQLFIEDLNSRNFTQLNGEKLETGKRYALKNGDELRLGTVLLVYISI